jgi:hypothetical protein
MACASVSASVSLEAEAEPEPEPEAARAFKNVHARICVIAGVSPASERTITLRPSSSERFMINVLLGLIYNGMTLFMLRCAKVAY